MSGEPTKDKIQIAKGGILGTWELSALCWRKPLPVRETGSWVINYWLTQLNWFWALVPEVLCSDGIPCTP